jgi:predicted porin
LKLSINLETSEMKKSLITLALLAASGAASAQSSVTLFGVVDATVRYVERRRRRQRLVPHQLRPEQGSRLGFRGTEDLGGGLSASFWLEAGLNNDNGTGVGQQRQQRPERCRLAPTGTQGLTFNRRSTVSLAGSWGELRLGRDFVPAFWNVGIFDPFGTQGVGANAIFSYAGLALLTGGTLNVTSAGVRASNSISYLMPNMGGFYGHAMLAMGEQNSKSAGLTTCPASPSAAGTSNACKSNGNVASLRLGYASGPADVSYAWGGTTFAPSEQYEQQNLGASWNFGVAKLMGLWNQEKALGRTANSYMLGATMPIGAGEIKGSYTWGSSTNDGLDGSMIALGGVYNLSKRTALYTTYSYISNSGKTATYNYGLAGTPAIPPTGGNTWGLDIGVKHSF